MTSLVFSGFTKAGVDVLDLYLAQRGITRTQGTSGRATGDGIDLGFAYDLDKGTLQLDLNSVPEGSSPEHIEFAVQQMLESGKPFGIAGKIAERLGYNFAWG